MVSFLPSVRPSVRPGFSTITWKSYHAINFKFGVCIWYVSVQNWFAFGRRWPNFGPLVAKNYFKWVKLVVSDHYMKNYLHNPIQTCCPHLLGECSEMIRIWVRLVQFCPSSGKKWIKVGQNGGFRPLSYKSIRTIQFKLGEYTYWVNIQVWLGFGPRWSNFGPLVATEWLKMVVSNHHLKK